MFAHFVALFPNFNTSSSTFNCT